MTNLPAPQPPPGFEILRLLGDGSSGLVFLARDLRNDREVALKEFRVGDLSAQRFFRELSLLFTLEHPHLIRCLNFVYGKGGSNFLVLEYAAGGNLRGVLESKGTLNEEDALMLASQMAGALECAHRHQVIHCDVKPENILLTSASQPSQFKLTDLGIAYHRFRDAVPQLGGSPLYMAPEQFYDRPVAASDFYSLGVVLFECLTGNPPFSGSKEYLFAAHTREMPDLEGVASAGWRRLLSAMLDKDSQRRPTSWTAMRAILENGKISVLGSRGYGHLEQPLGSEVRTLESCLQLELSPVGEARRVPGARDLWAPFASTWSRVWVVDERCIDWLDADTGRLRPRERIGRFEVGAVAMEGDASVAVISNELHVFLNREGPVELYPVPRGLCSLVQLGDRGLWAADGREVYWMDPVGRIQWRSPCPSYVYPTVLAASKEGDLFAARGPVNPALMRWTADQKQCRQVEVPGPVLAAGYDQSRQSLLFVVQGVTSHSPCRLMAWTGEGLDEVASLMEGVFSARWIQGCFVLMTTEQKLWMVDHDGCQRGCVELAGSPMQVVWVPSLPGLVALSKKGASSVVERFQFQPKCEAAVPQGVNYVNHL